MTISLPQLLSDQLPNELDTKQRLLQKLHTDLRLHGYLAVNTPLVEHAELFLIKAGDAAINRLVSFDLTGHTLCIRPEFTAPAARVYIEHFQDCSGAVRLQMQGPILQYENLKHGEVTQQDAIGAELINEDSAAADAEVIALASSMLTHSAVPWSVTIGHSGLIDRFIDRYELDREMRRFVLEALPGLRDGKITPDDINAQLGLLEDAAHEVIPQPIDDGDAELALQALMKATPQRGPSGGRTREEIARRLLEKQQRTDQRKYAAQALRDLLEILDHAETPASLHSHLRGDALEPVAARILETFSLLEAHQVPSERINFDLSFTRNLDYYTGVVFEFRTGKSTGSRILGGGGRYDELIGLLGASKHVPAVGFMLYVDSIFAALESAEQAGHEPATICLCPTTPAAMPDTIRLAARLRHAGLAVTVDSSLDKRAGGPVSHLISVGQALTVQNLATGKISELPADAFDTLIQTLEKAQ